MFTWLIQNRRTGECSQIEANNRRIVRRTIEQAKLGSIGECRIELLKNKTQLERVQYQMESVRRANKLQAESKKLK